MYYKPSPRHAAGRRGTGSSPPASGCWTCSRSWHRGCGCCRLATRTRMTASVMVDCWSCHPIGWPATPAALRRRAMALARLKCRGIPRCRRNLLVTMVGPEGSSGPASAHKTSGHRPGAGPRFPRKSAAMARQRGEAQQSFPASRRRLRLRNVAGRRWRRTAVLAAAVALPLAAALDAVSPRVRPVPDVLGPAVYAQSGSGSPIPAGELAGLPPTDNVAVIDLRTASGRPPGRADTRGGAGWHGNRRSRSQSDAEL
jgi:hypothetical protein